MRKLSTNQQEKENHEDDNNAQCYPDWLSFADEETADDDFLIKREDIISDEGRFE